MLRSRSRSSTLSPPSSPRAKRSALSMAGIANLFIQMKRLERRAANQTVVVSGEPATHPRVAEALAAAQGSFAQGSHSGQTGAGGGGGGGGGGMQIQKVDVEYDEEYICVGGVNLPTLLRASRNAMLEHCAGLAANLNALVDEQWECTISSPKPGHTGPFKVVVRYMAAAIHASVPDAHTPVHLDKAKGVPGLMTIVSRKGAA